MKIKHLSSFKIDYQIFKFNIQSFTEMRFGYVKNTQ